MRFEIVNIGYTPCPVAVRRRALLMNAHLAADVGAGALAPRAAHLGPVAKLRVTLPAFPPYLQPTYTMQRLTLLAAIVILAVAATALTRSANASRYVHASVQRECDVRGVMREQAVAEGTMALNSKKAPVEITSVLTPAKMTTGNYALTLTRVNQNVYRDEKSKLVLITNVCNESAMGARAGLRYMAAGGKFTSATISFQEP